MPWSPTPEQERAYAQAYQNALDAMYRSVVARLGTDGPFDVSEDDPTGVGAWMNHATEQEWAEFVAQVDDERASIYGDAP
jgi:hypothetical protein